MLNHDVIVTGFDELGCGLVVTGTEILDKGFDHVLPGLHGFAGQERREEPESEFTDPTLRLTIRYRQYQTTKRILFQDRGLPGTYYQASSTLVLRKRSWGP